MDTSQNHLKKECGDVHANQPTLRQTFVLPLRSGLHSRPCVLLVKKLRCFACQAMVETDGRVASGLSILELMSLGAVFESKLTFTVCGREAPGAMAAVQRLFATQFDEAYAPETKGAVSEVIDPRKPT